MFGSHGVGSKPGGNAPTDLWRSLAKERPAWIAVACFGAVLAVVGWRSEGMLAGATAAGIGVALGCAVAAAAHVLEAVRGGGTLHAGPVALAASGIALTALGSTAAVGPSQMGLVVGAAAAAWILGSGAYASGAACCAALAASANMLGDTAVGGHSSQAGTAVAVVAALGALIATVATRWVGTQRGALAAGAGVVGATLLMIAGGWVLGHRYLYMGTAATLIMLGAAAGWVVHWAVSEEREEDAGEVRFALGAVVSVALATLAFSALRGYGMALSTLSAASVLVIAGNTRALLSIGPALALVGYRVFRETHTDVSRAFDIGQHYAIVGILLGILGCMAIAAWRPKGAEQSPARAAAVTLSAVALIAAIVAGAVFLGSKGVVGGLIGLGLAVFVSGMRGSRSPAVLVLALQGWATLVLAFGWLRPWLDLTRDDKLALLGWFVVIGAALAWTTVSLGRAQGPEEVAS